MMNLLALHQTMGALGLQERPGVQALVPIRGNRKQESRINDSQLTYSLLMMGVY